MSKEERTHNEGMKKEMKERNTPGPAKVRAEEIEGTGAGGKRETGAECMERLVLKVWQKQML